jgi:hypothetical protein
MNVSLPIRGSPDSALVGPDPLPTFTAALVAGHSSAPPAVPPAALFTPAAVIPPPAASSTTGQPPHDWCVDVFRGNHRSPGVLPNVQHKFAMLKGNPFRVALRAEIPVLQDKTRVTIYHPTFWNAFNHLIPATANGVPEQVVWSDFVARIHNAITQIPYGCWSTLVALAEAVWDLSDRIVDASDKITPDNLLGSSICCCRDQVVEGVPKRGVVNCDSRFVLQHGNLGPQSNTERVVLQHCKLVLHIGQNTWRVMTSTVTWRFGR